MRCLGRLALVASAVVLTAQAYDFSTTNATESENRIYGGVDSNVKNARYIASLRMEDKTAYCGASLIAAQFLLTAAHCIFWEQVLTAAIGSEFANGTSDGEYFDVTEVSVHPKYNGDDPSHDWDVAVLKMNGKSKIKPVQLAKADGSDEKEGTMAIVRGWGKLQTGNMSMKLQEVKLPIISRNKCRDMYKNIEGNITNNMICAGTGGGKDSCSGDSGGPLIANNRLIGCVSWGGECGEQAGIYTRISKMLDFVKSVVNGTIVGKPPNSTAPGDGSSSSSGAASTNAGQVATQSGNATVLPPSNKKSKQKTM